MALPITSFEMRSSRSERGRIPTRSADRSEGTAPEYGTCNQTPPFFFSAFPAFSAVNQPDARRRRQSAYANLFHNETNNERQLTGLFARLAEANKAWRGFLIEQQIDLKGGHAVVRSKIKSAD